MAKVTYNGKVIDGEKYLTKKEKGCSKRSEIAFLVYLACLFFVLSFSTFYAIYIGVYVSTQTLILAIMGLFMSLTMILGIIEETKE